MRPDGVLLVIREEKQDLLLALENVEVIEPSDFPRADWRASLSCAARSSERVPDTGRASMKDRASAGSASSPRKTSSRSR